MSYQDFVARKLDTIAPAGLESPFALPESLFPMQRDLVSWALRRGRAAIFADTGLGKSRMQVAWADEVARRTGGDVMILAPLAVAAQTVGEGSSIGVSITHCRDPEDVRPGINTVNYDRIHKFDCSRFVGVVLDESSVIKHHTAKTFDQLVQAFGRTPYRLCATATPAPNDWTELGTHAEFLGVCTRAEMLAEFFVHDGGETQTWRLKGHARHLFWKWVSQWGACVRKPSDLGYDDSAYRLPPLIETEHMVEADDSNLIEDGMLFALEASSLMERRAARKESMEARVQACLLLVKAECDKLAASNKEDDYHGLEAGIRGSAEEKSPGRSGIQGEEESAIIKGQDCESGVHEAVLREEPGEVQAHNTRAKGSQERSPQEEICGEHCIQGCEENGSEGVAGEESGETESSAHSKVRNRHEGFCRADGDPEQQLRNLRVQRSIESEILSSCGPLPQKHEGARPSVHELQSGPWKVQRRHQSPVFGGSVPTQAWIIWCELNNEQDELEKALGNLAFSVRGSMSAEEKEYALSAWVNGDRPFLISKPSIAGWGLNFQHCARMAFVGVSDSFEAYYQAVRRCYRFGQKREVHVHLFSSQLEGAVLANLRRKQQDAIAMGESLAAETAAAVRAEITGTQRQTNDYTAARRVKAPAWLRSDTA